MQWSGFVRKTGARDAGTLGEAVPAVRSFVEVQLAVAAGKTPSTSPPVERRPLGLNDSSIDGYGVSQA